jgi:hypothetical protein
MVHKALSVIASILFLSTGLAAAESHDRKFVVDAFA